MFNLYQALSDKLSPETNRADQQSCCTTENGAPSYKTVSNSRTELFFKTVRGLSGESLNNMLLRAWNEDPRDTLKLIFQTRDCRGGKGEKTLFIEMCRWLASHSRDNLKGNLKLVSEYGSWLDLVKIAGAVPAISPTCYAIMAQQLVKDWFAMGKGEPCSLVAKWIPSEGSKWDREIGATRKIAQQLDINMKELRQKYLTPMRQYLNVVERMMCNREWSDIDYSKVPGHAMNRLRKAFARHDPERFTAWQEALGKGEVKVNAKTLHPHEIITKYTREPSFDQVLESQWQVLRTEVAKLGSLGKTLVLSDVSGSMSGLPMEVSVALGLLISSLVEKPFRNGIITFETRPQFHMVKGRNLKEQINDVRRMSWGGSTDFSAVFKLILERARQYKVAPDQMPERLIVLSDMQFNQADSGNGFFSESNYEFIVQMYQKHGYQMPQIVFWNLRANTFDFPIPNAQMKGVCLMSGFSPSVLKALINRSQISPYQIMRDSIDDPRYDRIRYF